MKICEHCRGRGYIREEVYTHEIMCGTLFGKVCNCRMQISFSDIPCRHCKGHKAAKGAEAETT